MDIIILHGTLGSPDINWFPWLKEELEGQGHTVYVPRFPTPENQSKESWCAALREQAPVFNENTAIVGHSVGGTLLLHVLETLNSPISKAVFVAPVLTDLGNEEYDALNKTFTHHPFNWEKMKSNAKAMHILYGDDDPYVPLDNPTTIAQNLNSTVEIIPGGGHLNAETGYTEFPRLLELLP